MAVAAEREVSRAMGGSCSMPLAAHAAFAGEYLQLRAAWGDAEGSCELVRAQSAAAVADLGGKCVELIREILPFARRVVALVNAADLFSSRSSTRSTSCCS